MKKRLLAALAAVLLLLSACSGGEAPAAPSSPPPESAALPSQSPAPALWWEEADLADLPGTVGEQTTVAGVECLLLARQEDVLLFCGLDGESGGYLLVRGEARCFLPSPMTQAPQTDPRLQWGDFDGDGEEELLLLTYDRPDAARLALCRWDGEGWSAQSLTPEIYNPLLLDCLTFRAQGDAVELSCGGETVSYTLGAEDEGPAALCSDFSGLVFFRVEETAVTAVFGVGIEVDGQVRYIANLTAGVSWDGSAFSLDSPRLTATGGV